MIEYKKDLEVGDFYQEIKSAAKIADTIFVQLGLNYARQWFRENNGTYDTIEYLVGSCLNEIHKKKTKSANLATGGLKVEMFMDEEGMVMLDVYFDLTL